jgi:hypothetical protein
MSFAVLSNTPPARLHYTSGGEPVLFHCQRCHTEVVLVVHAVETEEVMVPDRRAREL